MSRISITIDDASPEEALKIIGALKGAAVIAHEDRPDVGLEPASLPTLAKPVVPQAGGNSADPAKIFAAALNTPSSVSAPASASVPVPPAPVVPAAAPVVPSNASATVPANVAVPASTVELDSRGLPWDSRIHASTKSRTKVDNVWVKKRGLNDEAFIRKVEDELRQMLAARAPSGTPAASPSTPPPPPVVTNAGAAVGLPIAPPAPAIPAPTSVPTVPSPGNASSVAVASPPPAAPPAPTMPVQPSVAIPASGGETFGQLMARLAPLLHTDASKAAKINEALAAFQLTSLSQLAGRADLVPAFTQTVDAMIATA